jgi:hypothetical protein
MRATWLAVLLSICSVAPAQQNSANRTIPATQPSSNNLFVRLLRPLEPEKTFTPLTGRERFHEYLDNTFGPYALVRDAAAAGMRQGMNSPHEWGGGAQGYGQRFANAIGFSLAQNGISYGLSAALHEDNRYFASGKTGMRRVWHAALGSFQARHDDGSVGFSYSNVGGVLGASAVSLAWAPPSWRTASHVGQTIGFTFAGQAAFNIFREFLPDLLHRH